MLAVSFLVGNGSGLLLYDVLKMAWLGSAVKLLILVANGTPMVFPAL